MQAVRHYEHSLPPSDSSILRSVSEPEHPYRREARRRIRRLRAASAAPTAPNPSGTAAEVASPVWGAVLAATCSNAGADAAVVGAPSPPADAAAPSEGAAPSPASAYPPISRLAHGRVRQLTRPDFRTSLPARLSLGNRTCAQEPYSAHGCVRHAARVRSVFAHGCVRHAARVRSVFSPAAAYSARPAFTNSAQAPSASAAYGSR